jgi:hypothetical protein
VVVLLTVVVLSYRQLVHAYPSGGGDYQVASENLGHRAGGVVASALLVDYVLTVAVSVSAGVDNLISAFTGLADQRVPLALLSWRLLTAMNLRGVKESGKLFAIPTYGFVLGVLGMVAYGLVQAVGGDAPVARAPATRWCPRRARRADRAGLRPAGAARLRHRLHGADRGRGDRQRGARPSAAPRAATPRPRWR